MVHSKVPHLGTKSLNHLTCMPDERQQPQMRSQMMSEVEPCPTSPQHTSSQTMLLGATGVQDSSHLIYRSHLNEQWWHASSSTTISMRTTQSRSRIEAVNCCLILCPRPHPPRALSCARARWLSAGMACPRVCPPDLEEDGASVRRDDWRRLPGSSTDGSWAGRRDGRGRG